MALVPYLVVYSERKQVFSARIYARYDVIRVLKLLEINEPKPSSSVRFRTRTTAAITSGHLPIVLEYNTTTDVTSVLCTPIEHACF